MLGKGDQNGFVFNRRARRVILHVNRRFYRKKLLKMYILYRNLIFFLVIKV